MRLAIPCFVLFCLADALVHAQCPGGVCPVPQPAAELPAAGAYRWTNKPGQPGQLYLLHGNRQVGHYDLQTLTFRPLLNAARGEWGEACDPPYQPPCFGVELDRISNREAHTLNGVEVGKKGVYEAIGDGLTDDSGRIRVSIFGEGGAQVAAELQAARDLDGLRDSFTVRAYPADHWAAKAQGFVTDGKPSIYVQSPTGKVLHRQDDYAGGSAVLVASLLKAKAGYDGKKDPDLRAKDAAPVHVDLGKVALIVGAVVCLGFLGFTFFKRSN